MDNKDIVKQIIENYTCAFNTQSIINDLTTRKVKVTKKYITKTLKEMGYTFNRSTNIWKKEENIETPVEKVEVEDQVSETITEKKPVPLGYLRTYITELHMAIVDKEDESIVKENRDYLLGVFTNDKRAIDYANMIKDNFQKMAEEMETKDKTISVLQKISINSAVAKIDQEDLIFTIN